jgi:amidophosphoribosyltransferase
MQGIIGIFSKEDATRKALYTLYGVQHRGQESAGVSAAGDRSLRTWKDKGLVSNVFDERFKSFGHPDDYVYIGCASGENTDHIDMSPVEMESERYLLSLALDGYVSRKGSKLNEEVIGASILEKLMQSGSIATAVGDVIRDYKDSYFSMVLALFDREAERSELVAARDRYGIRPLYMGSYQDEVFIASESAPLEVLESMGQSIDEKRDVAPGSIIRMNEEGMTETKVLEPRPAHCVFEWVYFGRPDSVIEGKSVHSVRKRLGHALVKTHSLRDLYGLGRDPREDLALIPVPDSGRSVCTGVAEGLGIHADEGVIKNAYLGRTYIIDDPNFRKIASDLKHNIIRETVEGKKVVITDDSIVRGTVSESIAQNLLKAGAAEVDFLVSYGPIYYPCFSDPEDKLLAASQYKGKGLAEVGDLVASKLPSINNVRYNSLENVVNAIGIPEGYLCIHCMSGHDPFRE